MLSLLRQLQDLCQVLLSSLPCGRLLLRVSLEVPGGGSLVNLVVVRPSACRGFIGKKREKFCLVEHCEIRAHATDKFVFPEDVEELVFIATGSAPSAYTRPSVELSAFGLTWDRYRSETRTLTGWQVIINELLANPRMTDRQVNHIGDAMLESAPAFTPFKRRRVSTILTSPTETESEESFEDVTYIPLLTERPPTTAIAIESILTQWKAVGHNFELLHSMAASAKKGNKELDEILNETLNQIETRLGEIRATLGDRLVEMGTSTVFSLLSEYATDMVGFTKAVNLFATRLKSLGQAPQQVVDVDAIKGGSQDRSDVFPKCHLGSLATSV